MDLVSCHDELILVKVPLVYENFLKHYQSKFSNKYKEKDKTASTWRFK